MGFTKEQRAIKQKIADEIEARRENIILPLVAIAKAQNELEDSTKLNMIKVDHVDFFNMVRSTFNGEKRYGGNYWDNDKTIDPLVDEAMKEFSTFKNYLTDRLTQLDQIKLESNHFITPNENKIWVIQNTIKEFERYTKYLTEVKTQLEVLHKTKDDLVRKFYDEQRTKYGIKHYASFEFDQDGNPDEFTKGLLERSGKWKQ